MLIFIEEPQWILFNLDGSELSELAADVGLKTSLQFCSPVQTALGEEVGQLILRFIVFSFDLILMVQSAALEFGGLDTENKGFVM